MSLDAKAVTKALEAQGLVVDADEGLYFWKMSFTISASDHPALLMLPAGDAPYFLAMAPINSEHLATPFASLSVEVLRAIIRIQAETLLAKFHIVSEGKSLYAAFSPCSIDQWTGEKLVARLHACADLAARIRAALLEIPKSGAA